MYSIGCESVNILWIGVAVVLTIVRQIIAHHKISTIVSRDVML